jgi:large subunit ribosomal protein L10
LTDYRGLTVAEITALRRGLEKAGAGYHVVKNTLFSLALQEHGIEGVEHYLDGPTAVAFGYEDVVATAKAVDDYAKDHPVVKIRGGWMEGAALGAEQVVALASLPPRPVLLGQVAGTIRAPMANLVNGLASMLRQVLYALKAREEQIAEADASAGA